MTASKERKEAEVAIVVPVYQAEKYLRQCVESVLAQTYSRWELILVDDGSDDSSPAICDGYAARDSRIRVIHKENGGVSSARNAGVAAASAPFLSFLDADDLLHPRFIELLLPPLARGEAQISMAPYLRFRGGGSHKFRRMFGHGAEGATTGDCGDMRQAGYRIVRSVPAVEAALYQTFPADNSPWGKIYRSEITSAILHDETIRYEDLDIFYRYWLAAENVAVYGSPLYGYRQHESSYMHKFSLRRADALTVTDRIVGYMSENHPQLLSAALDRRMSAHFNFLLLMYRHGVREKELEDRCWRIIRGQRRESLLDRRVRLKNKIGAFLSIAGGKPLMRILSKFYNPV